MIINYTVQQMKKSWKHLRRDYVGLIGFDERWKTVYSVLGFQVRFSGHPNFWFFDFGRLLRLNQICYEPDSLKYVPKNQKFNNLSKTGSFVEIFQREPKKFCLVTRKNVKNWHFLAIFSTKTRHNFAVVLATSIKVGFKIKYNCYIWRIWPLSNFSKPWCGNIRVRTWNRVHNANFHLI